LQIDNPEITVDPIYIKPPFPVCMGTLEELSLSIVWMMVTVPLPTREKMGKLSGF